MQSTSARDLNKLVGVNFLEPEATGAISRSQYGASHTEIRAINNIARISKVTKISNILKISKIACSRSKL